MRQPASKTLVSHEMSLVQLTHWPTAFQPPCQARIGFYFPIFAIAATISLYGVRSTLLTEIKTIYNHKVVKSVDLTPHLPVG